MKFENPFERDQIKGYLLFYAGVVVIVVLFFIATTLFHEREEQERKEFVKAPHATMPHAKKIDDVKVPHANSIDTNRSQFKLLEKIY